ncbi:DUF4880 domain-containing protein [Stenotrophomonas sp. S39]|uniref:DUF4880 domain-containing protein n=1 Tax=Stenotrophomonas sp. S39 TaxID=2767451 RepID=UPI001909DAA8|nr:DUF4880 domain-containing protein [Stenotrophomonas sp. S39]MBK0052735.1 DUF4880 domain-containing protein [Stenotrophomonas sp. S39]
MTVPSTRDTDGLDAHSEAAVQWWVELRGNPGDPAIERALHAWLSADPAHATAWQRLQAAVGQTFGSVQALPDRSQAVGRQVDDLLQQVDRQARKRRQLLSGMLSLAGIGAVGMLFGRYSGLLPDFGADLRTATAQRGQWTLADGTHLLLDARSAIDLVQQPGQTRIRLRGGQLIATCAAQRGDLEVSDDHGQVRADRPGASLLLRRQDHRSLVVALQHPLWLHVGSHRQPLQSGEGAWLSPAGIEPAASGYAAVAADWRDDILSALDTPLAELIAQLRSYHHGLIWIDSEVGALRVSGRYPLADPLATLQTLAQTLPIDLQVHSNGLLVRIGLRAEGG